MLYSLSCLVAFDYALSKLRLEYPDSFWAEALTRLDLAKTVQESIIKLSVSKDPRGGWTARMGSTFGDRGKCEGQNIPPLECVIETRWPGVKVYWNGHDPIL